MKKVSIQQHAKYRGRILSSARAFVKQEKLCHNTQELADYV